MASGFWSTATTLAPRAAAGTTKGPTPQNGTSTLSPGLTWAATLIRSVPRRLLKKTFATSIRYRYPHSWCSVIVLDPIRTSKAASRPAPSIFPDFLSTVRIFFRFEMRARAMSSWYASSPAGMSRTARSPITSYRSERREILSSGMTPARLLFRLILGSYITSGTIKTLRRFSDDEKRIS